MERIGRADMDIINVSVMGVRSVVLRLRHRDNPLRFTVYPMIHLAEASFYERVAARLAAADLVVMEGVQGPRTRLLTMTYRLAGGNSRLGLVVQPHDLVPDGVPVVRPDMTAEEWRDGWRQVHLHERALVWFLAPIFALSLRIFGTRRLLARVP